MTLTLTTHTLAMRLLSIMKKRDSVTVTVTKLNRGFTLMPPLPATQVFW